MGLFRKKCTLCHEKIDRGKEITALVKVPVFVELKEKPFCSEQHLEEYKEYSANVPRIANLCSMCPYPGA